MLPQDEFAHSLNLIRERFVGGFSKSIDALDLLLVRIELSVEPELGLKEVALEMHRIAGVASTLGYPELGDLSKSAESCLYRAIDANNDPSLKKQAIEMVDQVLDQMSTISDHSN